MMSSKAQKNNQTKSRDYDKEPIVIEDCNLKVIFYVIVSELLLWELFLILNPMKLSSSSLAKGFIILPIIVLPTIVNYKRIKNRTYILRNRTIELKQNNNNSVFNLDSVKDLKISFQSYYTNAQKIDGYKKFFWYVFSFILVPFQIITEIQNYFVRKILNEPNVNTYNSLLLYFDNGEFINLYLKDIKLYNDLNQYCIDKFGKNIEDLERKFFYYFYMYNIVSKGD
ncbi:MAG: hypothetical protein RBS42_08785 [Campylobacterales bacterium]|nr:hypothetical protein [Campylobacterales bacterium]